MDPGKLMYSNKYTRGSRWCMCDRDGGTSRLPRRIASICEFAAQTKDLRRRYWMLGRPCLYLYGTGSPMMATHYHEWRPGVVQITLFRRSGIVIAYLTSFFQISHFLYWIGSLQRCRSHSPHSHAWRSSQWTMSRHWPFRIRSWADLRHVYGYSACVAFFFPHYQSYFYLPTNLSIFNL